MATNKYAPTKYGKVCAYLNVYPVSGGNGTVYADWTLTPSNLKHIDHYVLKWTYYTKGWTAFIGEQKELKPGDSGLFHPTYTPPSNAVAVTFTINAISETYKKKLTFYERNGTVKYEDEYLTPPKNKKIYASVTTTFTLQYWTSTASSYTYYIAPDVMPAKPSTPTVTMDGFKLTASLSTYDTKTDSIEFQVVKNDASIVKTGKSRVVTAHAAFTCNISPGGKYKVRARGIHFITKSDIPSGSNIDYGTKEVYGEWSEYSSNVETIPTNPSRITKHTVLSANSVQIYWNAVSNATGYDIEYAANKSYFDTSSNVQSVSASSGVTSRIIDQLDSGQTWFFRVRATNSIGKSGWSEIYSILLGKIPAAPTTWSATTSIVVGENVDLYWVHNSEDGSSQTSAQIEITVNGATTVVTRSGTSISTETGVASHYTYNPAATTIDTILDSSGNAILDSAGANIQSSLVTIYREGTVVQWRVRTKGVLNSPNLGYSEWSVMRTIVVYAPPSIELQVSDRPDFSVYMTTFRKFPICLRAVAAPSTQHAVGWNVRVISDSSYYTINEIGLVRSITAGSEIFSRFYTTSSNVLSVELSAGDINLDGDRPYTIIVDVAMDSGLTANASTSFDVQWDDIDMIPNAEIAVDEMGYVCYISPYCTDAAGELVKNVELSVYRREYDGRYKLIEENLPNDLSITITDPHPALDYARYRIVAKSVNTGEIAFYDAPDVPINVTSIIIQWDEDWRPFIREAGNMDPREEENWNGSYVVLPYNISVSDKYDMDVNLAEYIGRSHPVSYYGTQLGISGSWSSEIPRDDTETLYSLRRLAIYPGDVYVREPSGVGYWARVNVSFSKSYDSMVIPVTVDVTRVEGGV